jgi:hypothetical protein
MANPLILLDCRTFVRGADLSGNGNTIELTEEAEVKKVTNWKSGGAEENKAGIRGTDIKAGGQWEAGNTSAPDDVFWSMRRSQDPWSIAPKSDSDLAAGGKMYLIGKAVRTKFGIGDMVGEVAPWTGEAKSSWPLVKGVCAHPAGVARTATGTGTAILLGAVPAGKYLYANLHVLSIAGTATPSITVKVQSDDNAGFTTPTDVAGGAFAAATTVDGWQLRVAGPITDSYFRVAWTITGTTPSFLFLASFGIE